MNQFALLAATSLLSFIPQAHAAPHQGRVSDIIPPPPVNYSESINVYQMKEPKEGYNLTELKKKITTLIDLENHFVGEKKDNFITTNNIIWRANKAAEANEALGSYFAKMPGAKTLYSQKRNFNKTKISLRFQLEKNDISTIGTINLFKEAKSSGDISAIINETAQNTGISTKLSYSKVVKQKGAKLHKPVVSFNYFINMVPLMPTGNGHLKDLPVLAGLTTIKLAPETKAKLKTPKANPHKASTVTRLDYLHNVVIANGSTIQSWKGADGLRYVAIISLTGLK